MIFIDHYRLLNYKLCMAYKGVVDTQFYLLGL